METDAVRAGHRPVLPSDLGQIRTIMAADRTLMAWLRTSLSMLSFSFTIYKFLEAAAESGQIAASSSPQRVGMFLAGMGTMAMVLGTVSYWTVLKDINRVEQFRLGRPVLLMSLIMSIAGLTLFVSITERLV